MKCSDPPGHNSKKKGVTNMKMTTEEAQTFSPLTDTRTLRHYYRFLPDGRMQIGSRSAVTGRDAENPKHLALLQKGLYRKFPALEGIDLDYSW